jgi:hypothetical protein
MLRGMPGGWCVVVACGSTLNELPQPLHVTSPATGSTSWMLSLLGATGALALTLPLTAAGTLRRRPFALGAGLVLSSLGLLVLVGCLAGYPLLPAVGEGGLYADAPIRVPFFALLSVLVSFVVAADVVAAAAYLANRDSTAPTNAGEES